MSKANAVGDLFKENILREQYPVTGAVITISPALDWVDNLAFQLITEARPVRSITHDATDSVVASSGTWHFANGAFTAADVGATMTIANASNGGNNGAKTILTVVDATHVTTSNAGLVNETFGVTVTATVLDIAIVATWAVEASNDYVQTTMPGNNQVPNSGHWSPIANSEFTPAIAAVAGASSQYVQLAPFAGRRLRFTLTPTAGAALLTITYGAKGTR